MVSKEEFDDVVNQILRADLVSLGEKPTEEKILEYKLRAKSEFVAVRDEKNVLVGFVPLWIIIQSKAAKIVYSQHVEKERENS